MNVSLLFMYLLIYIPVFIIFISMPYLTRKDELFGVKIPEKENKTHEVTRLKKSYLKAMALIEIIILMIFIYFDFYMKVDPPILATYGMFIIIGVYFGIYLFFHKNAKKLKADNNWDAKAINKVAVSTDYRSKLKLPSPFWFLLYIVIISATLYIGYANYNIAPEKIPLKFSFNGEVTSWADKSPKFMLFAPATQVFITILMAFVYWTIKKSKQQIDPQKPDESILRDRVFRYRWSLFTIFMGLLLMLLFGFMQLTFIGFITNPKFIMITSMLVPGVIIISAIILSFTTGQGGSRVRVGKTKDGTVIDRSDDKHWKLGVFYFNPDDPAIFVQKRFGIGWTNNFARPLTWIIIIGFLCVIAFFVIFSNYLTS